MKFKLDDDQEIQVKGKGRVALKTGQGKTKLLHDIQFVCSLAHNLLSFGQLMFGRYLIWFNNGSCVIKDKQNN